jgi:hypothetical protein
MEGGKLKAISPVIFTCNAVESVATLIRRHCNEALPVGSRPSGFRRERWRIFRAWPRAARMFVAARQRDWNNHHRHWRNELGMSARAAGMIIRTGRSGLSWRLRLYRT